MNLSLFTLNCKSQHCVNRVTNASRKKAMDAIYVKFLSQHAICQTQQHSING